MLAPRLNYYERKPLIGSQIGQPHVHIHFFSCWIGFTKIANQVHDGTSSTLLHMRQGCNGRTKVCGGMRGYPAGAAPAQAVSVPAAPVCLVAGCGKPTWNGSPNDYCSSRCKKNGGAPQASKTVVNKSGCRVFQHVFMKTGSISLSFTGLLLGSLDMQPLRFLVAACLSKKLGSVNLLRGTNQDFKVLQSEYIKANSF